MARILGTKERIYWELYDTDFCGVGNVAVATERFLFQSQNQGRIFLTNLSTPSQLPSDNTGVVLAMGYTFISYTCRFTTTAARDTSPPTLNPTEMAASDVQFHREMWELFRKQTLLSLRIGEKVMWSGWVDNAPAGQGTDGAVAVASAGASGQSDIGQFIQNNGSPCPDCLLRFAKPAIISCRQQFQVEVKNGVQATQNANTPPDVLDYLNAASEGTDTTRVPPLDYKFGAVRLFMILTRDVQ